jgi:hypothetical protein
LAKTIRCGDVSCCISCPGAKSYSPARRGGARSPACLTQRVAVAADLTKRPPEWPRDSAIEASVRKMKPHQRSKLAKDILDIFVTLSGGL